MDVPVTRQPSGEHAPDHPDRTMARRHFLGLAAGTAVVGLSSTVWPNSSASAATRSANQQQTSFAFFTDVHIQTDLGNQDTADRLQATIEALQAANPEVILDGGDLTDYGREDELQRYMECVAPVESKLHAVPGNHAVHFQWDGHETWRRIIGPTSSSLDIGDLHIVMFNTSVVNQGAAFASEDDLAWLRDDLEQAGRDRPTLLVTHHPPMGAGFYFLQNQDEFFETIKPYRVRGIFSGHTHAQQLRTVNGLTVLVGKAHKANTGYYRCDRETGDGSDLLRITYVAVPDPARGQTVTSEEPVTTIALGSDAGPGETVEPSAVDVQVSGETLQISTTHEASAPLQTVAAAIYDPYRTRGQWQQEPWTELTLSDGTAQGELPLVAPEREGDLQPPSAQLPPGDYRVIVRSVDSAGDQWRSIVPFVKEGPSFVSLWENSLGGSIHGAVARVGDLVVAASTNGTVAAFGLDDTGAQQWETTVGPVYNDLAVSADESTIFVPSFDGHLYALDAADGSERWRTDLGVPVLSDPLATTIDGGSRVVQTAGTTIYCLDADNDGAVVWDAAIGTSPEKKPSSSAGRPACDGKRVYFGCGTGYVRSVDARDGVEGPEENVWQTLVRQADGRSPTHAPWVSNALLLPGERVMVGTVGGAHALNTADGSPAWDPIGPGNFVRCHAAMVEGHLLVPSIDGVVRRVNPANGNVQWSKQTANHTLNAEIVAHGSTAYTTSTTGIVCRLDAAAGAGAAVEVVGHLSNARVIATPVLSADGGVLVAGDQAGVLKGFAV